MAIESEMTGNRTMYYSHGHNSARLDLLVDKVKETKKSKNGYRPRPPRICGVCGGEVVRATRFCSQLCFNKFRKNFKSSKTPGFTDDFGFERGDVV